MLGHLALWKSATATPHHEHPGSNNRLASQHSDNTPATNSKAAAPTARPVPSPLHGVFRRLSDLYHRKR